MYCDPERQQLYQLSQIAATMAVDLELHKPTLVSSLASISFDRLEEWRTLLGCYYITST